jgi:hypothetical protein
MLTYDVADDSVAAKPVLRMPITSFDTGHEHSLEHLIDVQRMVDDADAEPHLPVWLHALGIGY